MKFYCLSARCFINGNNFFLKMDREFVNGVRHIASCVARFACRIICKTDIVRQSLKETRKIHGRSHKQPFSKSTPLNREQSRAAKERVIVQRSNRAGMCVTSCELSARAGVHGARDPRARQRNEYQRVTSSMVLERGSERKRRKRREERKRKNRTCRRVKTTCSATW